MILTRFITLVLVVVAAIAVAAVTGSWWIMVLALVVLVAALTVAVLLSMHYISATEWLGAAEEARLQDADLVEFETGLPSRGRFRERCARRYADQVARRGVTSAFEPLRGSGGAEQVLLLTTVALTPAQLRAVLSGSRGDEPAVLVVVPALPRGRRDYLLGAASEGVARARAVCEETVAALRSAQITASGHIGAVDPAVALADGLRTFEAQRVVVVRHAHGGRYLERVPLEGALAPFGVSAQTVAAEDLPKGARSTEQSAATPTPSSRERASHISSRKGVACD